MATKPVPPVEAVEDPKDKEGTLLAKVRELLDASELTALEIYKATGVAPNQQWAIRKGKTKAPSVNAVEALFVFLTGRPLEL
jgi:hypothetical protein